MKPIYPYPTLAGAVELEVLRASVDGIDLPLGMFSTEERVIALRLVERDDWRHAGLLVKVKVPYRELEQGTWQQTTVAVVAREKTTCFRTVTPLRRQDDGTWTGNVRFERSHHASVIDLDAVVVATVEGIPGRLIGGSDASWRVELRSGTPTRRNSVATMAVDFASEAYPFLNDFKDDPWVVAASSVEPVIYVNTRVEGLWSLLNNASDAPSKGLRGAVSAQIASQAWSAMFSMALQAIELDDDGPSWPGGWQENVLRRMLPDVIPDASPNDALRALIGAEADLQPRITHAAGRQAQLGRHLGSAIRSLHTSRGTQVDG